jgi:OFA family oxalate/formate antiporter-like MFS transporter
MTGEIGRGWRLIVASSIGVICSSVVLPFYTIGALVKPLTAEFGWSRSDVQLGILFSSGLGALTAPLVGWLSDHYGPRALVLPGLVGLGAGFFLAAIMDGQLWMFFLAYSCMAILGAGTTPITWTRAIASNFDRQRGLALGLTLTGTGICAILAPSYAIWLVDAYGWRVAYMGIGLLPLLIAGPIVWLWFRPNQRGSVVPSTGKEVLGAAAKQPSGSTPSESGLTIGEAVRGYRFWVLCFSIFAIYMAVSGISPNLIAALTDNGFTTASAATVHGVYGFAIIVGRLVVGYLIDRFWAPGIAVLSLVLPVGGCLILAGSPDFAGAILAALLIGFAAGAELDLMAFFAARYFGLRHYAKIYAVMYALLAVAGGTAPMLFARVYDVTASYQISFIIAAILFLLGAVVLLTLGRYPRFELADGHPR